MNQVNTTSIPILFGEKKKMNCYDSRPMVDEIARTVRLPKRLWDALDRDAVGCKRSSVKQLEAVLSAYYLNETSSLNLRRIGDISPFAETSDVVVPVQSDGAIGRRPQTKRKVK